MNAVQRVTTKHGIFRPTFEPITERPLAELKHAATSPSRLLALVKASPVLGMLPHLCTRILDLSGSTANGRKFESCSLIPGGRFLVTVCDSVMELWDLGTAKDIINPKPIAFVESTVPFSLFCSWIPDDEGIVVIVGVILVQAQSVKPGA